MSSELVQNPAGFPDAQPSQASQACCRPGWEPRNARPKNSTRYTYIYIYVKIYIYICICIYIYVCVHTPTCFPNVHAHVFFAAAMYA